MLGTKLAYQNNSSIYLCYLDKIRSIENFNNITKTQLKINILTLILII